jgi:hypothetical protein
MKSKIESEVIWCARCAHKMELNFEDGYTLFWQCPKCFYTCKGDIPDPDQIKEMMQHYNQLEKTNTTIYVKINDLQQVTQLKELLPELNDISIADIKKKLLKNNMKWPVTNFKVIIDMKRSLAEMMGLEIVDDQGTGRDL